MELKQKCEEKKKQIDQLIRAEWRMFGRVNNIGGRASCQDDFSTFYAMRYSQFLAWEERVLDSYEEDVSEAEDQGRNLVELKYGYMMQYTEPEYYQKYLAMALPPISGKKRELTESIMELTAEWYQEAKEKYPHFVLRGRPEENTDQSGMTSVDVYLRGELYTYSERTLERYLEMMHRKKSLGENMICEIYGYTAKCYGFKNLDEAELSLR